MAVRQQVRSAHHQDTHAGGRAVAEKILATFTGCPIPEVARLGRTLRQWRAEFLGYFDTGANNGGTGVHRRASEASAWRVQPVG